MESSLRIKVRSPGHDDFHACTRLLPDWLPLRDHVRDALPIIWTRLLHQSAFNADVMEDLSREPGDRLIALGMSVALDETWQQRLMDDPPPCVAAALYEALYEGSYAAPSDAKLGALNAAGKVAFMVLHYSQRLTDMDDADTINLLAIAMSAFRDAHSGFRLSYLYQEGVGSELEYMASMGFVPRTRRALGAGAVEGDERYPELYGLSYADALKLLPGTPVRDAFQFTSPVIGFSASERRLLRLAVMRDMSDEGIGAELDISSHTIKKLWRSIHQRVADRLPALYTASGLSADVENGGNRGPEKRRVLIPYLREHLEELRPYAARARALVDRAAPF